MSLNRVRPKLTMIEPIKKNGPLVIAIAAWIVVSFSTIHVLLAQKVETVVAIVGDSKIYQSQIDFEFDQKFAGRSISEDLAVDLRKQILGRLVDQQLVMLRFTGTDIEAHEDEVNMEVSKLRERLTRTDSTLDAFLSKNGQSIATLRFNFAWQISWKRYIDKTLTDEVLENYFDRHESKFDGTRLRVSHILLQLDENADDDSVAKAKEKADEILIQLKNGDLTWEQATGEYSDSPTGANGGEAGWIDVDGPMPRNFTDAAFGLEEGKISEPVQTRFGLHLIKVIEVEDGEKNWYDVKAPLKKAATEELFEINAKKQRDLVEVRYP